MSVLSIIAQLLVSLSILVVLHELGHFLPAKFFKTRVEKFYLFFDPWFSLFRKKIGETVYGIGWLPLGGYVKIAGMVDESLDTEQLKQPPQPWEFRSKPAWQRLIIMLGGVTVNFILGFLIFGLLLWGYGERFLPAKNVIYGIAVDSLTYEMGLRDGDYIVRIGDLPFDEFDPRKLVLGIAIHNAQEIEVVRNGRPEIIPVDPEYTRILSGFRARHNRLIDPRFPFVLKEVVKDSPAERAGLISGDSLIAINGEPEIFYHTYARTFRSSPGEEIAIGYVRNNSHHETRVAPDSDGLIGVLPAGPTDFFNYERRDYTLLQALPAGVRSGWNFLTTQFRAFGQIFRGKIKATESLGGFGTIGQLFPSEWHWEIFWRNTAILSLILAFINLLPIPALDGGHVAFLLYEAITGRKPSDKFMEYATIAGFAFIIALVLFVNGLDIWRWLTNQF